MLHRTTLIVLWLLVTCLSPIPRIQQQSTPVDGLQLVISSAGHPKTGVPVFRVEFRNTTSEDLNLNLGIIGGWSPRPCLDQFYSPRPGGYDFKLGPGKYRITLEFDAPGETNRALVEKMKSWKGRVRSTHWK